MCVLAKPIIVFAGAGGVLEQVASAAQHFVVCNTSSLLWLLAQCVHELMTVGDVSPQPTIVGEFG